MAQFDVYNLPGLSGYAVEVQHAKFADMKTRVVVPLMAPAALAGGFSRLNPKLELLGEELLLMPQLTATVPVNYLEKPVGNLSNYRDKIIAAMDMLVTGI